VASKFAMPPIAHTVKGSYAMYELRIEVLECIIDATKATRLLD
jgi:hypothetical protein